MQPEVQPRVITPEELRAMVERERLQARGNAVEHAAIIRHVKGVDVREGMRLQALAFHVLTDKTPGVTPWDAEELYRWATTSAAPTSATRHAVRFLLELWNSHAFVELDAPRKRSAKKPGRPLGPFNVLDAIASWDMSNRAAFLAWAEDPWWP